MLEQKIEALTAAVEKLTAALDSAALGSTHHPVVHGGGLPADYAEAKPISTSNARTEGVKRVKEAKVKEAEEVELEYNDVKGPFIAFIESKGHEAAAALLAKFGIAKLPALPPEKFGAMLAAIAEAS